MDKPKGYGFIRNGGLKNDVAFDIREELKRADLSPELRLEYFQLLTKLALHKNRAPGKPSKKNRASKKSSASEVKSSTDWGKKLGGE